MRSYRQHCGLAKALDVVGDRWTLLLVRELLLGQARYTDLLKGLPGIATNLLAARLSDLEAARLVVREVIPPPMATTVFRLTARGEALRPVVHALGRWAAPLVAEQRKGDRFQSRWLALPIELNLQDAAPAGPPFVIQVHTGDEPVVVASERGRVRVRAGMAADPDVVISGAPDVVLAVLLGKTSVKTARARGLRFEGDAKVLRRLRPIDRDAVL